MLNKAFRHGLLAEQSRAALAARSSTDTATVFARSHSSSTHLLDGGAAGGLGQAGGQAGNHRLDLLSNFGPKQA